MFGKVFVVFQELFVVFADMGHRKQKSILKHQKLLLQDVTLGAWVLKNTLKGKDQ